MFASLLQYSAVYRIFHEAFKLVNFSVI